ncbi:MAG: hypothetical protein IKS83_08505, partial [Victivallales bacterium]|nr:hypothetical protein [Victivallales bacterium]
ALRSATARQNVNGQIVRLGRAVLLHALRSATARQNVNGQIVRLGRAVLLHALRSATARQNVNGLIVRLGRAVLLHALRSATVRPAVALAQWERMIPDVSGRTARPGKGVHPTALCSGVKKRN